MSTNSEFLNKLKAEEPLTMAESHLLDQVLADQEGVQSVLSALEGDAPSMAWRSRLNEQLISVTPSPRERRFNLRAFAGLGTAVACVVAVALVLRSEPTSDTSMSQSVAKDASVEQVLLDVHRSASFALATGAGDGSAPTRSEPTSPVIHWTESDLESF